MQYLQYNPRIHDSVTLSSSFSTVFPIFFLKMSKFGISNENMLRAAPKPLAPAPAPVASRRRILGDITNSHVDEDNRDASRKPAAYDADTRMQLDVPATETRIYMQRPPDDIDANARDLENPQMAASYANDIYENFFSLEREFRVNHNYMSRQEAINEKMRCILVDWLVRLVDGWSLTRSMV